MIKRIHLRNFQSHHDTHLRLSKGVNVILGPSDVGKTAIIRALRWNRFNRPLGEGYRKHGSSTTSVTIETDKGTVTRERGERNGYQVNGEWLEAMKGDVPDKVAKVLGFDEDHIQGQMDSPFMLSQSPAEAGRQLSKAAGLDDIQGIFGWLAAQQRDAASERLRMEEEHQKLLKEMEDTAWAEKAAPIVKRGQAATTKLNEVMNQQDYLVKLMEDLQKLGKPHPVESRLATLRRLEQIVKKWIALSNITTELGVAQDKYNSSRIKVAILTNELPDVCPTCGRPMKGK